jgi:hypothetical protein
MNTYTIAVAPSTRPGKVTAKSSDGHTFTTSMPLLDGARHWLTNGANPRLDHTPPTHRRAFANIKIIFVSYFRLAQR